MDNDKEEIPIINLKGEYLSEPLACQMLGVTVAILREMVKSKEIKGFIHSKGDVSVLSDAVCLTLVAMARMMHVSEKNVIEWIESGALKALKIDGDYKISYQEYTRFGKSGAWMPKFHDSMFEYIKELTDNGEIIQEVNDGFRRGMQPHIDKAKEVIDCLEQIHVYCDKKLDVLNDKTAIVAAHVITAKLISILYSSLNMIEREELIGASALFRTVYEGVDLVMYFILSEGTKKGQNDLNRWFNGGDVKNTTCRDFIVSFNKKNETNGKRNIKEIKDALYDAFCGLVHLNYKSIMHSYNALASSGFGQEKIHRMGFDYKSTKLMRKSVDFLNAFEGLLRSVLTTFLKYAQYRIPLEQGQVDKLQEYRDYYSKSVSERNVILRSK